MISIYQVTLQNTYKQGTLVLQVILVNGDFDYPRAQKDFRLKFQKLYMGKKYQSVNCSFLKGAKKLNTWSISKKEVFVTIH